MDDWPDFLDMVVSASNGLLSAAIIYISNRSHAQSERLAHLANWAAEARCTLEIHYTLDRDWASFTPTDVDKQL